MTTKLAIAIIVGSLAMVDGEPPAKRAHHALIYDESNKCILMTTGSTPVNDGESFQFFNDLWCFDGKSWSSQGSSGDQRSGVGLTYNTKQKKIYSFGGFAADGSGSLSDLRVLENGQWKIVSELSGLKLAEAGLVYDKSRDRLVVFGGSPGQRKVNEETWEWDGSEWQKFSGVGPRGRQSFAMVYDDKRKKIIVYGGMGPAPRQLLDDMWEYDGKAWTKISDGGPGGRASMGFTYDSKRGMLIIFGGMTESGFKADTWGWDGKEWKQLASEGPSKRAMGYIAYDKNRDRVVLFGGRLGWPTDANDTWEWDGEKWEEVRN